jgi:hypothetical protein
MPLNLASPSSEVQAALRQGLADFGRPLPDAAIVRGSQVFTIGLDSLAGQSAAGAKSTADGNATSWRIPLRSGGTTLFAEVKQPPGAVLTSLSAGIDYLPQLPDVGPGNFTASILRLHGLRIDAFYLKPENGSGDLIVPYYSLNAKVPPMYVFAATDFFQTAIGLAQYQLKLPDQQSQQSI